MADTPSERLKQAAKLLGENGIAADVKVLERHVSEQEGKTDEALHDLCDAKIEAEAATEDRESIREDLEDMRRGLKTPEEVYDRWLTLTPAA